MELVLKTSGQQCLVGSNPTASAIFLALEVDPFLGTKRPLAGHCKNCKDYWYRPDTQLLFECNRLQFRHGFACG